MSIGYAINGVDTHRAVGVKIGEKDCRIESDDNYLDYISGEFEPHMVKLFRSVASDSQVIWDIGANIGCTSILFGDLAQWVYSFEPSPTTYSYLQKNVETNGNGNIILHNIGLGSQAATTTITFAPNNRSGGFVSNLTKANADHITEEIRICTVDDIAEDLALPALDFIKIDVEGFEGHVLRGARKTLERYRPIVVLELNHWCLNAFQRTSVPDFFDQLRETFPILLAIDGNRYLNLHSSGESYEAMYHHIMAMRYQNILCGFDESRLEAFHAAYLHAKSAVPDQIEPEQPPDEQVFVPAAQVIANTPKARLGNRALNAARRIFR